MVHMAPAEPRTMQAWAQVADMSRGDDRSMISYVPVEVSQDMTNVTNAIPRLATPVAHATLGKDSIHIDMEIRLPEVKKKEKPKKKPKPPPPMPEPVAAAPAPASAAAPPPPVPKPTHSLLSLVIQEQRHIEPQYFQNVDCVGVPDFFYPHQCERIINYAEDQGFSIQQRHRLLDMLWTDIVDPLFAEQLWKCCGLETFLSTITIDGMVPCGVNDVIRIQKYVEGSVFGKHTDQHIERSNGRVSKYSLRVFLNNRDRFEGGLSAFHVPHRTDPVVFEPETGLALIYPQGDLCTVQEEQEVLSGCKYVLRADILFRRPDDRC
mmetsp:Transcript_23311/g.59495  ORF Transcript_23311/g.59495 Transcript_23311/m.59495 type:complete len:321 (-) Transcript_23311:51-1013(-)